MDLETLNRWVAIFALLIGIANAVWFWVTSPGKEARKRFDDMLDNLKTHDRRIQTVENEVKHLPTKDDMAKLDLKLTRVETECESMGRTLRRIDDHLRSKG